MRFTPLIRLLIRNHISLSPAVAARILFLLQSALWSSLFTRAEKLKYTKILAGTPVPDDPLFIVGHWRTGSTFLHQLLSLHTELTAPTLFQVALPEHFLVSYPFYKPVLSSLMGSKRPMDDVRIGLDEPQEDEYALFRLTTRSPLEKLIFPDKNGYFLEQAAFLPPEEEMKAWEEALKQFYRKIFFQSGKQIVSKNPFNSFRIQVLSSLFPRARFIHIFRHPYDVIPSTRHLWQIVQAQNRMNNRYYSPTTEELSRFYGRVVAEVRGQFAAISATRKAEVRYEDLDRNPVATLQALCSELGISFPETYESSLTRFLEGLRRYRKNQFTLSDEEKRVIKQEMAPLLSEFAYE